MRETGEGETAEVEEEEGRGREREKEKRRFSGFLTVRRVTNVHVFPLISVVRHRTSKLLFVQF